MRKSKFIPYLFLITALLLVSSIHFFPHIFYSKTLKPNFFESQLHQKEKSAHAFLNELVNQNHNYFQKNSEKIKTLSESGIFFFVEENNRIVFWTSSNIPLNSNVDLKNRNGIVKLKDGWYEYSRIKERKKTYTSLILIKNEYSITNDVLNSNFHADFSTSSFVEISIEKTPQLVPIHNDKGEFLFSLNEMVSINNSSNWIMMLTFLIAFACFIIFIFHFLNGFSSVKKYSGILSSLFVICFYFTCTYFSFPEPLLQQKIFSPSIYAHSYILPSLGHFLLASFSCFSIVILLTKYLKVAPKKNKFLAVAFILITSLFSVIIVNWFVGVIINSSINFEVVNLLDLSAYSFIGIFNVIVLFLGTSVLIKATINNFSGNAYIKNQFLPLYWCSGLLIVILSYFLFNVNWIISSWFLIVILIFSFQNKIISGFYQTTALLVVLSILLSYGFIHYSSQKNELNNQYLLKKLSKEKDPITEYLYQDILKKIESDTLLQNRASNYWENKSTIDKYLADKYFNGYWSKYDINSYICKSNDTLLIEPDNEEISCIDFFNNKIETEQSSPFQEYDNIVFLYTNGGASSYLATASITNKTSQQKSYLFFEMVPKILSNTEGYPELLLNKKETDVSINVNKYSFAKYKKNKLATQIGPFNYSLELMPFIKFNDEGFATSKEKELTHLFYQGDKNTVVVLTSKQYNYFNYVTTFSYFFLIISLSSIVLGFIFKLTPFSWRLAVSSFSSKIQLFIILSTTVSFVLFGWGTTYYIQKQYSEKNTKTIQEKVRSIVTELETDLGNEQKLSTQLTSFIDYQLIKLSNVFYTDINLYDLSGQLFATSRPEITEQGLINNLMNPIAYNALHIDKKSSIIHDENISSLQYLSSYVPFRNDQNKIIGYLNLPYFAKQNELERELSSFFTALINIYALLFLISIIISIVFANYISEPLTFIKNKIGSLQFGKSNELIEWNSNDEIGALVKEYNKKVIELEKSANLLAKSERESAWREMAKQVAHEIKNPLTPMKLSIQHLERSISDSPEDMKDRVKRTAKTLIDQIDTLTNIANEFSNFAKMPKANQQKIDLREIIESIIDLYKEENISIQFDNKCSEPINVLADKDQINRVFSNLIKNAIQAIPDEKKGKITISTYKENKQYKIEVTDNGNGIPAEQQNMIFTPNFTTKTNGMGLGLAMVKNIVENSNGSISFETSELEGTTFIIELPIAN